MDEQNDELKESLTNMFKEGRIEDAKLAAGIITANPDLVPLKDIWYNINDLITKDTIKYVELYCKEGSHDKVYIIIVNKTKTFNNNIIAYYGRRGKNLRIDNKGSVGNWKEAVQKIMDEKIYKKGYTIINEVSQ